MSEEMKRHCTYCCIEIDKGFVCNKCKAKAKKASQTEAQRKYHQKRKAEMEHLQKENEQMRKIIEELKNAD